MWADMAFVPQQATLAAASATPVAPPPAAAQVGGLAAGQPQAGASSSASAGGAKGPWLRRGAGVVALAAFGVRARGRAQGRLGALVPSGRRSVTRLRGAAAPAAEAPAAEDVDVEAGEGESRHEAAATKRPPLKLDRNEADGTLRSLTLTTPLFYANGSPHIGSAYPTIASDVMARYAAMQKASVHFVTGMDEHGEKIAKTAEGKGKQPQEMVDEIAQEFKDLWSMLSIENGHFARTTLPAHRQIVAEMWQRCLDKGDIYKKDYEGWYCVGCEAYLDDDEMEEGHVCSIHRKPCELRREENYFFRLSKYWDDIRNHLEANPDFILPSKRRNEVLYWLKDDNKRDFSISRASTKWGIDVPGDDSQVIYVWFDALLGYLSSLLEPGDEPTLDNCLKRGWPADVHVIGKDIMRFHAIYWPAMLMSADLPLPKHIATHGFLTKDGLKMGKSLGNVVEPVPLVENFGADAVRFFFSACLAFGEDGDFTYEAFIKLVNSRLANDLGNLVHRLLTLCRKNMDEPASVESLFDGDAAAIEEHPVYQVAAAAPAETAGHFEQFDFPKAALSALAIAVAGNVRMNEVEPWAKLKGSDEDKKVAIREMVLMAEAVRVCAVLIAPLTPELSFKILTELGAAPADVGSIRWADSAWQGGTALTGLAAGKKPKPVFQRIDLEPWKGK